MIIFLGQVGDVDECQVFFVMLSNSIIDVEGSK
jgi:hypothetical protein